MARFGRPLNAQDFVRQRQRMIDDQLRSRGLCDRRVLAAMAEVPREEFVAPEFRDRAYYDGPLPIGLDQTISQPYTVAFMCEALKLKPSDKVLEVGAGCGYAAAVLSRLAGNVITIERFPELAAAAAERLAQLGYDNVRVVAGDGCRGAPEDAPFDAIVAAAAAPGLPESFVEQLADGGRIVLPIGERWGGQMMYRFIRHGEELLEERLGGFSFVPLVGEFARYESGHTGKRG
jgi:protein-L-isoaspartate(D-aspartate) O-methyltransferase